MCAKFGVLKFEKNQNKYYRNIVPIIYLTKLIFDDDFFRKKNKK